MVPATSPSTRPSLLTKGEGIVASLALLAVLAFFYWTAATSGGLPPLPLGQARYTDHYNLLLHGLLKGQLHLDVPVDPAMLSAPNPYDPKVWVPHGWMIDASFYNGKYYIYYGIAPLLVFLLPFRLLTGADLWLGTAGELVTVLSFLALVWLWLRIRRDYFSRSGGAILFTSILALGFLTSLLSLARRPMMYEFAIGSGCFFAALMLHCAYSALRSETRRTAWMLAAGFALGLAFGSRPTFLFTIAGPGWVLLHFLNQDRAWRESRRGAFVALRPAFGFAVGLGVPFLGVLYYNYLRFGSGFDFGYAYLLQDPVADLGHISNPDYVWFNLRNYYSSPLHWSRYFPFITAGPYPDWPERYYGVADLFGILRYVPVVWFALAAPLVLKTRATHAPRFGGVVLGMLFLAYLGPGLFLLSFGTAFPRYEVDFRPWLILLSLFGVGALDRALASAWAKRTARGLWCVAAAVSVAIAAVHSIPLQGQMMVQKGNAYFERVARTLNYPVFLFERAMNRRYGPVTWRLTFPMRAPGTQEKLIETPNATLLVEYLADDRARFGLRGGSGANAFVVWGEATPIAAGKPGSLSASFGSLYPHTEHPYYLKHEPSAVRQNSVTVILDGRVVLRALHPLDPVDVEKIRVAEGKGDVGWFSGSVQSVTRNRLSLADLTPDFTPRSLHLELPAPLAPGRWPLISAGAPGAGDVLFIEIETNRAARWGYFSSGSALQLSAPFPVRPKQSMRVTVQMEALAVSGRSPGPRRPLTLEIDGRVAWTTYASYHPSAPGAVRLGANDAAAPGVAAKFPGAIDWADTLPRLEPSSPGDHLFLRVVFPAKTRWGLREPLLLAGVPGAYEGINVVHYDDGQGRFVFDHNGDIGREGPVLDLGDRGLHDLEIILPVFARGQKTGTPVSEAVIVKMDGKEVLHFDAALFPARFDQVTVGENRFGGPTEKRFIGDILMRRWAENPNR